LSPPHVTRLLITANVIIFLLVWLSDYVTALSGLEIMSLEEAIRKYGMIPYNIMNGKRLHTLFTSMFLHGGVVHLVGNMLYLHIFGDNIEYAFGRGRYLAFYLLCGIAASVAHILSITTTGGWFVPAVGASGAISGVLGAYLLLYPRARVLTLVLVYWVYIVHIPAVFFLGFWFIFQFLEGMLTLGLGMPSGVAYWAHIGGFVVGIALAPLLKKRRPPVRREWSRYMSG
jgi:membrane associated rhomboid family serine protease